MQRQKAAGAAGASLRTVILTVAHEHCGQDDFEEAVYYLCVEYSSSAITGVANTFLFSNLETSFQH